MILHSLCGGGQNLTVLDGEVEGEKDRQDAKGCVCVRVCACVCVYSPARYSDMHCSKILQNLIATFLMKVITVPDEGDLSIIETLQ